jgi:GT2 family glycosyltransferase
MDDDARPEPGALGAFRDQAPAMDGWEALAAGVFYPDGAICEMNRPSRNPFWHFRHFLRTALGGGRRGFHVQDSDYDAGQLVPVDACSFVGFFVSRRAIARAGLPDGRLFIYGDDVIYTLRLSQAGGRIGFAPWIRFEHECSTLNRGSEHIHRPLWKTYYNYRNGLLAYRLAAGPVFFWPVLLTVLPKWLAKARRYGSQRRLYRALLALAVRDALTGRLGRSHAEIRRRAGEGKA